MLSHNAEEMRLIKQGWREKVEPHSASVAAMIFLAKHDGWKVAVLQAQGLKRGMKQRFGFDVRKGCFLTRQHKRRAMKQFTAFCLHAYTLGVAREMVLVTSMLAEEVDAGKCEYSPSAFFALAGVHSALMEGYIPYELFTRQRGQHNDAAALTVLQSYVRSGLKRSVPSGDKAGYDMRWAQAIMAAHPDLSFEQALQEELPAQVCISLQKIIKPHLLFQLRGKVAAAFEGIAPAADDLELLEDTIPRFGEFEAVQMIAAAENCLSSREFQVFELKRQDRSPNEIAQMLGIQPGTVRATEFDMRKKLKQAWA